MPERFELGTLPYELLAGVTAAVDFIADLALGDAGGPPRPGAGVDAARRGARGACSSSGCSPACDAIDGVRRTAARPAYADGAVRRRRAAPAAEVHEHLAARGVNAPASSFYAIEASRWLGLGDAGAVRAGLAPYTSDDDVDRLLAGVAELAR